MEQRKQYKKVLDLGAGDGKFAIGGNYDEYWGYEIDPVKTSCSNFPHTAKLINECAFTQISNDFDLCIGNPPYVRHHDLNDEWQQKIASKLSEELGIRLDRRSNAFIYFLCQSLLKTKEDGVVIQVIPYEWVTRPATEFLRTFIKGNNWNVDVYRFEQDVFAHSKVLTTACITVIDKSRRDNKWSYYRVNENLKVEQVPSPTGYSEGVLGYMHRGQYNFAQRGLSPGGQKVFCLDETTRLKHSLKRGIDVVPCITSLKYLPYEQRLINNAGFEKYYVKSGAKCWLILPNRSPSNELSSYLESVDEHDRSSVTCQKQSPWWCYKPHDSPDIIYGSGFTNYGPKILVNGVKAVVLGTVHGVHKVKRIRKYELVEKLREFNFESKIVKHSGALKKIEVNQMNWVLDKLIHDRNQ